MEETKQRMISEVGRIIKAQLISHESIRFPEVGSLILKLQPAAKSKSGAIIEAPRRVVEFVKEQQGVSLVDLIERSAECDREQAKEVYKRFLKAAKGEKDSKGERALTFAGVGVVAEGSFKIDADFDEQINPKAAAVKSPKRKKKGIGWLAILLICCVVAGGISYFGYNAWRAEQQRRAEAAKPPVFEQVEPEPLVEKPVVKEEPKPIFKSRYMVVYGLFSTPENVERAKREVAATFSYAEVEVYPYQGRSLVTIFESDSRREAQEFLNDNVFYMPEIWVYERE